MQEIFKFKDHDIQFLKLFWQTEFDETWILLDEPFIETWLIHDTNLNLNQLYQHVLFTMFHKEADYCLSLEANPESMYMVKGHCLKDLCIICNKIFRDFFIRLARVAHMLVLTKSIENNSTELKLSKTTRQLDVLTQKTDNLTFIVEDILGERVDEIARAVIQDNDRCDEVVNLIKLPSFVPSSLTPVHVRNAGYIVIRCLRKNYEKHLHKIERYGKDGLLLVEEMFDTPLITNGINIVKELKIKGVKTHKTNGVSHDNHLNLSEIIKEILKDNINK